MFGLQPQARGDARGVGIFGADMGGRQDREIAVEEVEPDAAMEGRRAIVVADAIAEGGVHAGVDAGINIEPGDRHGEIVMMPVCTSGMPKLKM